MKKLVMAFMLMITAYAYGQNSGNAQLDSLLKTKDSASLKSEINKLATGSEKDMELLLRYYSIKRDQSQREALAQQLIKKYPAGNVAFQTLQKELRDEKEEAKQQSLYADMKKRFNSRGEEAVDFPMAMNYLQKNEPAKAAPYTASLRSPDYAMSVAMKMAASDSAAAKKYIKTYLALGIADSAKNTYSYKEVRHLYGKILVNEKNYEEALPYIAEAYQNAKGRSAALAITYASILENKRNYKELIAVLETWELEGKANAVIKEKLEKAYLKTGVNPKKAMAGLAVRRKAHVQEEVAKMMINQPSPDFILKDAKGNPVSLADLKGKILVLDFWATWCGPCKSSFPAMKTAQTKYQDDPNVKFLFVHTWESQGSSPLKEASAYLNDNNYPFDLYIDDKDAATGKNPVVTSFGVTGIPTKFIIDGKGNIRFSVRGFSGADEATVEELTAMIDMIKKS